MVRKKVRELGCPSLQRDLSKPEQNAVIFCDAN